MFALHLLMGKFNGDIINAVQELLSSSSTVIETSRMMATMIVLISIISKATRPLCQKDSVSLSIKKPSNGSR